MLIWQPNSTLHCMPLMRLSQLRLQNFRPNTVLPTLSNISWLAKKFKIQPKYSTSFFCCIHKQSGFYNLTFFAPQHSTLLPAYLYQKDERIQTRKFLILLPPIIKVGLIPPLYFLFFFAVWSLFKESRKGSGLKATWRRAHNVDVLRNFLDTWFLRGGYHVHLQKKERVCGRMMTLVFRSL